MAADYKKETSTKEVKYVVEIDKTDVYQKRWLAEIGAKGALKLTFDKGEALKMDLTKAEKSVKLIANGVIAKA